MAFEIGRRHYFMQILTHFCDFSSFPLCIQVAPKHTVSDQAGGVQGGVANLPLPAPSPES